MDEFIRKLMKDRNKAGEVGDMLDNTRDTVSILCSRGKGVRGGEVKNKLVL